MTMRVAGLIALYALLAIVGIVFLGNAIPPCFGDASGHVSKECYDHWLATRSPVESFFSTPWPSVVTHVGASALTIWWDRRSRRRR